MQTRPLLDLLFGDVLKKRTPVQTLVLAIALAVPLGFAAYTNEIWEDFLITYRHSENLIQGHGLVFNQGERVHGFTSPLNVLLPALFGWVTQARDYALPLLGFRLVSFIGYAIALLIAANLVREESDDTANSRALGLLFPLLAVFEIKTTAFAMNGQEAGLLLGFLVPVFLLACRGWPRQWATFGGICIAGLMYTRPDAFVHCSAAAFAGFCFCSGSRADFARSFVRSAVIGFLIYLPWLCFAQLYYGTFVPHTIIAKRGTELFQTFGLGLLAPLGAAFGKLPDRVGDVFSAIYDFRHSGPGAWPGWVRDLAFGLTLVAVTYWLVPTRDRIGRAASLCACLLLGYLSFASTLAYSSPWYYPPLCFISLFALVRMAMTFFNWQAHRLATIAASAVVVALVVMLGFIFSYSVRALKLKQDILDSGNRRMVGLWLREAVRPNETVFLEPLGYIGYFSQRNIRDYPGLVAPDVVAARRKIGRPPYPWAPYYWGKVAEELKPDWIVARPHEADQMRASPFLRENYRRVQVFNVTEAIIANGEFYGSGVGYNDVVFEIFRRRPAARP